MVEIGICRIKKEMQGRKGEGRKKGRKGDPRKEKGREAKGKKGKKEYRHGININKGSKTNFCEGVRGNHEEPFS